MVSQLGDPPIAVQTLVLVAVLHEGGNKCPLFGVQAIEVQQDGIFFLRPGLYPPLSGMRALLFYFHVDPHPIMPLNGHSILSQTYFFHYFYRRSKSLVLYRKAGASFLISSCKSLAKWHFLAFWLKNWNVCNNICPLMLAHINNSPMT